jgi:hypothetical protein
MDRLDVRTACFFVIGLLVLTFGCHGAHLHGLGHVGHGLGHVGHGASAVAHVAAPGVIRGGVIAARADARAIDRVAIDVGRGVAMTAARSRESAAAEGGPVPAECAYVCPAMVRGAPGYVCATPHSAYDPATEQMQPIYVCAPPR